MRVAALGAPVVHGWNTLGGLQISTSPWTMHRSQSPPHVALSPGRSISPSGSPPRRFRFSQDELSSGFRRAQRMAPTAGTGYTVPSPTAGPGYTVPMAANGPTAPIARSGGYTVPVASHTPGMLPRAPPLPAHLENADESHLATDHAAANEIPQASRRGGKGSQCAAGAGGRTIGAAGGRTAGMQTGVCPCGQTVSTAFCGACGRANLSNAAASGNSRASSDQMMITRSNQIVGQKTTYGERLRSCSPVSKHSSQPTRPASAKQSCFEQRAGWDNSPAHAPPRSRLSAVKDEPPSGSTPEQRLEAWQHRYNGETKQRTAAEWKAKARELQDVSSHDLF